MVSRKTSYERPRSVSARKNLPWDEFRVRKSRVDPAGWIREAVPGPIRPFVSFLTCSSPVKGRQNQAGAR
jgi:hypothetical protein